ncbi:glutaminyl-peptide cyclotransferase-like isoform X2 [Glandiceps talaboti]
MTKLYVFMLLYVVLATSDIAKSKKSGFSYETLTPQKLATVASLSETHSESSFKQYLNDILILRPPGSEGNRFVRGKIIKRLEDLGWEVDLDQFTDDTPFGKVEFGNVVGTLNPLAKRRLVIACHYDSKYFPPQLNKPKNVFLGAIDSAVPCAMMLDLAKQMDSLLKAGFKKDITLQLIFFDGEEAFEEWTNEDSLYGSRHLAAKMATTMMPDGKNTHLDAMDVFILLDLIGYSNPVFHNHYSATSVHFQRMENIEKRLNNAKLLSGYSSGAPYFQGGNSRWTSEIQDDHKPFVDRGVKALHLIVTPFPRVWHQFTDNKDIIDYEDVENISRILRVYVAEHLGLEKHIKRKKK